MAGLAPFQAVVSYLNYHGTQNDASSLFTFRVAFVTQTAVSKGTGSLQMLSLHVWSTNLVANVSTANSQVVHNLASKARADIGRNSYLIQNFIR